MARQTRTRQTITRGDVQRVSAAELTGIGSAPPLTVEGRASLGHATKLVERALEELRTPDTLVLGDERQKVEEAAGALRRRLNAQ